MREAAREGSRKDSSEWAKDQAELEGKVAPLEGKGAPWIRMWMAASLLESELQLSGGRVPGGLNGTVCF